MIPTLQIGGLGLRKPLSGGGDPYYSFVSSLHHFNGADGSTTFTDEKGKTWAANGNAQLDTAQQKFGTASLLLDGSGDYATTSGHSDFDVTTEDLTVEAFIRLNTGETDGFIMSNRGIAGSRFANWNFAIIGGKLRAEFADQTTGGLGTLRISLLGATTVSTGSWHHVAMSKSGSSLKIFLGGVQDASGTLSGNPAAAAVGSVYVGYEQGQAATYYYNGHMDELRVTKGVARYTSGFTPPSAEFPND